jgi:hypothetical protein
VSSADEAGGALAPQPVQAVVGDLFGRHRLHRPQWWKCPNGSVGRVVALGCSHHLLMRAARLAPDASATAWNVWLGAVGVDRSEAGRHFERRLTVAEVAQEQTERVSWQRRVFGA